MKWVHRTQFWQCSGIYSSQVVCALCSVGHTAHTSGFPAALSSRNPQIVFVWIQLPCLSK